MGWYGLSTREWATVFWALVLLLACIAAPKLRRHLVELVRVFFGSWKLVLTLLALLIWVTLVCYVGYRVGAWKPYLLKDTVAWIAIYGFASIYSATRAGKEEHFFRRAVLGAIGVGALMQFLLNLHTFHIAIELVLQPIVTFLFLLELVAGMEAKTHSVQRLANWLIAAISLWVAVATAIGLWSSWRGLASEQTGIAFAFSIWFPLAMLPFVYALALSMSYEAVFLRASVRNSGKRAPRSVKAALLVGLRGNLHALNELSRHSTSYQAIVRSNSFGEALKHVRTYLADRELRKLEAKSKAARLVQYAGVHGVDEDGKLLDQREVKETQAALRWLHICQMGRHNNDGSYRSDLLVIVDNFERHGLPTEHGISMRVSSRGQAWYAWRRLPIGYVLAIGAAGHRSEWLYEGEEPPKGHPGQDGAWANGLSSTPPNWR